MELNITVYGTPQPQGSTKAFIPKGWNRAIITSDNKKTKPWRQEISGTAIGAMKQQQPEEGPVEVHIVFWFEKPKSAAKKVIHKITKPDIDKLARAVLDSLTGIAFRDDSQVVSLSATKRFVAPGTAEGAGITVRSVS